MIEAAYRGLTYGLGFLPLDWSPAPRPIREVDILLHGASAGEVKAASSWRRGLEKSNPNLRILQTAGTATGVECGAEARLPRDVPKSVGDLLDTTQPGALILTEGELWPNLLRAAAGRNIPIGVLGARMSKGSQRMWSLLGRSGLDILRLISAWATSSEDDAQTLVRLGLDPARVRHTGWLKWPERPATQLSLPQLPAERLFVLGSLHPGELEMLLDELGDGPLSPSNAHWVLVLRHPNKEAVIRKEATRLLPAGCWHLDARFGIQDSWYSQADAVFVGGGGKGRGVHDLLAPLAHGHPPLCFLSRGDPGSVGETLTRRGLALPLDLSDTPALTSAVRETLASTALERPGISWSQLRSEYDGRQAATAFFRERGVLP